MSEPTFPFATGDTAEDDVPPASRRRTLVALSGLGVVALGVAGYLVLTGPDEAVPELGLPAGTAVAAPSPVPTASPSAAPPATALSRAGRDPFRGPAGPGTVAAAPAPAAPEGAPVAAPAVSGDGALPGSGPALGGPALEGPALGGAPLGAAPVSDSGPADQPPAAARTVSLVRVAGDQTAVLSVDGSVEPVRVGEDFGPGGSLLLLSVQQGPDDGQWTAVVQQGSGDPFDVMTGRPATVT